MATEELRAAIDSYLSGNPSREACRVHFRAAGHDPATVDALLEEVLVRKRTESRGRREREESFEIEFVRHLETGTPLSASLHEYRDLALSKRAEFGVRTRMYALRSGVSFVLGSLLVGSALVLGGARTVLYWWLWGPGALAFHVAVTAKVVARRARARSLRLDELARNEGWW